MRCDNNKSVLQYAPYIRTQVTTNMIMADVCIALIPVTIFGIGLYGVHAALIILTGILASVGSELAYELLMKKRVTISDMSALLTGLLLSLTLPPSVPLWIPALGGIFGIIVVKQLYGGIGCNIMNPALAARCFLHISYTGLMTDYITPAADGISSATPLAVIKTGEAVDRGAMFLGITAGSIGETSVMAIIIGAVYLVYRRVITVSIPLTYIASFIAYIVIYSIISGQNTELYFVESHLFGGGLLFGAFFMATDYVTSPMSFLGKCIYGTFAGLLTGILRIHGAAAEGVSYAILCANMITPLIDGKETALRKSKGE